MSYSRLGQCAGAILFLGLAVFASGLAAAEDSALPRYRFEPGQRLTYYSSSSFKYENGSLNDSAEWQMTVIGKNGNGSYRTVITQAETEPGNVPNAKPKKNVQCGYADIDAEGNITQLFDSFGYRLNPRAVIA